MRQIWIRQRGGPDVLELREAEDPAPGPGEVRIRVGGAGINFADIMARIGLYPDAPPLPAVVGYEVAGEIDAVGEGVETLGDRATAPREGTRVVALTRFGGYSDVLCVPAHQAAPLPDRLRIPDGAGIPTAWLTAWLMLVHLGNVREGDRVLVHGASGGVGLAAVQICRSRGATIFGTASPKKHERLQEMGVHHCIDYRSQDFEAEVKRLTGGDGVEIALDPRGGKSFRKSYRCLGHLGRLYVFGAASTVAGEKRSIVSALKTVVQMPSFRSIPLMNENRGVHGVNLGHLWHKTELMGELLGDILKGFASGAFESTLDKTFPFTEAAAAHRYIQDRKNFGKVVLVPE